MTTADTSDSCETPDTRGIVLHSAARYDLLVWLKTLGRERTFRQKIVRLLRLRPGECILDVGCGTGTLAIEAKRLVGPTGSVHGVDASPEMIKRANKKAHKADGTVTFTRAFAQALPFPDGRFDAVVTTLMLHHLPHTARRRCALEMRRVLKPGGRVLVVDFVPAGSDRRGLLARLHRHGRVDLREVSALLTDVGLNRVESGEVGFAGLEFVLATSSRDC